MHDGHRRVRRRPGRRRVSIGYTGNVCRFASAGHYARYNATAPIETSSGPKVRCRLNPNGNRELNHAIHIAAVTQVAHNTPGVELRARLTKVAVRSGRSKRTTASGARRSSMTADCCDLSRSGEDL